MLLACAALQSSSGQEKSSPAPPQKTPAQAQQKPPTPGQEKTFTAEQIAESVVFVYGSRGVLEQIRRNGIERGRLTRITPDGRTEEATYERRFVRGAEAVKYIRGFHDYRYAQQTLVPYRSVLLADGKQVQETRILTVTYGLKLEDSIFQNPEAQTSANP